MQCPDHLGVVLAPHLDLFFHAVQISDALSGDVVRRGTAGTQSQKNGEQTGNTQASKDNPFGT